MYGRRTKRQMRSGCSKRPRRRMTRNCTCLICIASVVVLTLIVAPVWLLVLLICVGLIVVVKEFLHR